jgi:ribokinase
MRIVVFGSLNFDTAVDVRRQPRWGETILARGSATAGGGKGANQAVAAARVGGGTVVMIGRVGDDAPGSYLRAQLVASGVADGVRVDPHEPTGSAFILRNPRGANAIVVVSGANGATSVADLEALRDGNEPTLLVLQQEISVDTCAAAARLARRRHWHVVLNTAPVQPGTERLLDAVDTIVANEVEAAQLAGSPVHDAADAVEAAGVLLRTGPSRVAVTLGDQGAVLASGGRAWHARAPRVMVVDTTAAGDAFVGALAVAISEGRPEPESLALAVAAGSLATTLTGAQPSLPRRADVLRAARSIAVEELGPVSAERPEPGTLVPGGLPM